MTERRVSVRWSVDGGRIERERILHAWTRERLAAVAHIDPKTLRDLCSGRRRPALATIHAVCAALSLAVADVIVFDAEVEGMAHPDASTSDKRGS